jgi:hypothetical protein
MGLGQLVNILGSYWQPQCHLDGSTVQSVSYTSISLFQPYHTAVTAKGAVHHNIVASSSYSVPSNPAYMEPQPHLNLTTLAQKQRQ